MTPIELIKICSINSKWLIDIVHQLILFSKLESQLLKFIETNGENGEDFITFNKYFKQTESKFISLSKRSPEKDFGQTLIQNIRYLTININDFCFLVCDFSKPQYYRTLFSIIFK